MTRDVYYLFDLLETFLYKIMPILHIYYTNYQNSFIVQIPVSFSPILFYPLFSTLCSL